MDDKGNQKFVPLNDLQEVPISVPISVPAKPKRQGSLGLFFRKVNLTVFIILYVCRSRLMSLVSTNNALRTQNKGFHKNPVGLSDFD